MPKGVFVHRLTNIDLTERTATCANCGPVRLRKQGPKYRCVEGMRLQRRRDKIRQKYGIGWREWDTMLIAQSGRCAICQRPMVNPHVDHDHANLQVRGLLCQSCNLGLGLFDDDPWALHAAVDYLLEGRPL